MIRRQSTNSSLAKNESVFESATEILSDFSVNLAKEKMAEEVYGQTMAARNRIVDILGEALANRVRKNI